MIMPPMTMARRLGISIAACVLVSLLAAGTSTAVETRERLEIPPVATSLMEGVDESGLLPGVSLAQGIAELTGVAISPMLGVSVVGAWHYFRTPGESRHALPWFCHPVAWATGFSLLLLCFFKDSLGAGAPALVKKPFDVAELFENKISALVVSSAFIPMLADQVSRHFSGPASMAGTGLPNAEGTLLAVVPPVLAATSISVSWLLIPLFLAGFFVIWIVSHAINVLILLSPFGFIDATLKAFRVGVLALVAGLSVLSPGIGALFCVVLLVIAVFLAPWAFRLSVFGTVAATDLVCSLFWRSAAPDGRVFGFLAHAGGKRFPVRSGGWIAVDDLGKLHFSRKPLFLGCSQSFDLGTPENIDLRKGVFFPSLCRVDETGKAIRPTILLLPRYRPHLGRIADRFGIPEIGEGMVQRGFKEMLRWLRETASISREKWLPSTDGERGGNQGPGN